MRFRGNVLDLHAGHGAIMARSEPVALSDKGPLGRLTAGQREWDAAPYDP